MEVSKIQLSANELELVLNKEWILTKHRIINKVYELLGNVAGEMQLAAASFYTCTGPGVWQNTPKISKGEQYEQLPYVVLDYPRVFTRQDVFAVRNFFWWGHYFTSTLHLKGHYAETYATAIATNLSNTNNLFLAYGNNEFNFTIEKEYSRCDTGNWPTAAALKEMPFIKLAVVCPLQQWTHAPLQLINNTNLLLNLLRCM